MTDTAQGGERDRCGARKRQGDGSPCKLPAGWGTDHAGPGSGPCKLHGGATRNHRKAAADAQAEAGARAILAQLDVQPVGDPIEQLQALAGQALAWRDAIAERVRALTSLRYESAHGGEQLRAEIGLFERAMDRCQSILTAMAKLNLDERLVRLDEARGRLVRDLVLGVFADLGLPDEVQAQARSAIAARLRAEAAAERAPLALEAAR